jgi:hypothetical protein
MTRRYVRDKLGRFASKGGTIKSQQAAGTRVAGQYSQALKKNGDWELQKPKFSVRAVGPTRSPQRVSGRISNVYRGHVGDLRTDLRNAISAAEVSATRKVAKDIASGKRRAPKSDRAAENRIRRQTRREVSWKRITG